MGTDDGRKYKSRKERPCDACRKRKICCVREPGYVNCALCRTKSTSCSYQSIPSTKTGRPPRVRQANYNHKENKCSTKSREESAISQRSLANAATTGGERTVWISQFVGLSGDQDPFVLRHCSFDNSNHYKQPDWACMRIKVDGEIPMHFTIVPESHLDARPSYYPTLVVGDVVNIHKEELCRAYFDTIHQSFPLLDPHRFTEHETTKDFLLSVMYCMASPFTQCEDKIQVSKLYAYAFQAIPIESRHPTLETIEAALLFLQRPTKIHRAPTTPGLWSEIGSIVGMSHDLGLNVDPSSWDIPQAHRDRRIRIWWAVYIFDKWSALGLGRPSYLNEDNHNVPMVIADNIPSVSLKDVPLPVVAPLQFVAMAELSVILSDILTTFYTVKSNIYLDHLTEQEMQDLVENFRSRLREFKEQHLDFLSLVTAFPDPTGTVFLAFHTLEIVLYRAILRNIDSDNVVYTPVRLYARMSLESVTTLLETLQVSRLRAFWWSPIARVNFAIAGGFMFSLLLTSVDENEVEYWTSRIQHYHRLLEMQSISFDTTKLAAIRLKLLTDASRGLTGTTDYHDSPFSEEDLSPT